jgi:YVTN family beta-propeller protein
LISCRKDVGYSNPGNYPTDIGSIIINNCAVEGCHNSQSHQAAANFDLSSWHSMFRGSVNGSPVIPFNSRFSSLCYFINTFPELGIRNTPTMPLNRTPLPKQDVQRIMKWIDDGAPNAEGYVNGTGSQRRPKLYAVNQGCDVVTVFDAESRLPIRYINVGTKPGIDSPHQVRVSPDGNFWYVIFINNNVMQKFSCSDDSYLGSIPLSPLAAGTGNADAADWNTFVISADGRRAYCASWSQNGSICAVDLDRMRLISFVGGQSNPHAIALNGTGDKLYVATQTGNYISEFDTSLTQSADVYSLDNNQPSGVSSLDPHDMIVSPDGKSLWITCQKSNEVRVYNTLTHSVSSVIPTGTYPQEIVFSATTGCYYVSCTRDSSMSNGKSVGTVYQVNSMNFSARKAAIGHQPHGLAVDEARNTLYVLSRNISTGGPLPHHSSACTGNNGFVEFIDLLTFQRTGGRYELSVDPYFIYPRP